MTTTETLQRIEAETLYQRITGEHSPIVINALDRDAYQAKHIPGSINIPTANAEIAKDVIPYMDAEIVVYCANADCDASLTLAQKLEEMGYTNVLDFEDGLAGWKEAGYDLIGNDV